MTLVNGQFQDLPAPNIKICSILDKKEREGVKVILETSKGLSHKLRNLPQKFINKNRTRSLSATFHEFWGRIKKLPLPAKSNIIFREPQQSAHVIFGQSLIVFKSWSDFLVLNCVADFSLFQAKWPVSSVNARISSILKEFFFNRANFWVWKGNPIFIQQQRLRHISISSYSGWY